MRSVLTLRLSLIHVLCAASLTLACSDEDKSKGSDGVDAGTGDGSAGSGGSAGSAGDGGSAGTARRDQRSGRDDLPTGSLGMTGGNTVRAAFRTQAEACERLGSPFTARWIESFVAS